MNANNRRHSLASISTIDSQGTKVQGLHGLACSGDQQALSKMLQNMPADKRSRLINARNRHGMTALHGAAFHGQLATVEYLLECGADVNAQTKQSETENNQGATALHFACVEGHSTIVKTLLSHGADISLQDGLGCCPLDIARLHQQNRCERALLRTDTMDSSSHRSSLTLPNNSLESIQEVDEHPKIFQVKHCWTDDVLPSALAVKASVEYPPGTELASFLSLTF